MTTIRWTALLFTLCASGCESAAPTEEPPVSASRLTDEIRLAESPELEPTGNPAYLNILATLINDSDRPLDVLLELGTIDEEGHIHIDRAECTHSIPAGSAWPIQKAIHAPGVGGSLKPHIRILDARDWGVGD